MGNIAVHEFITLDGVIEAPSWTVDYPFDPKMGDAISALMGTAILLGRQTLSERRGSVSSTGGAVGVGSGCGSAGGGSVRERPALSGCSTPGKGSAT